MTVKLELTRRYVIYVKKSYKTLRQCIIILWKLLKKIFNIYLFFQYLRINNETKQMYVYAWKNTFVYNDHFTNNTSITNAAHMINTIDRVYNILFKILFYHLYMLMLNMLLKNICILSIQVAPISISQPCVPTRPQVPDSRHSIEIIDISKSLV